MTKQAVTLTVIFGQLILTVLAASQDRRSAVHHFIDSGPDAAFLLPPVPQSGAELEHYLSLKLGVDPTTLDPSDKLEILREFADFCLEIHDYSGAVEVYRSMLVLDSDLDEDARRRARILTEMGEAMVLAGDVARARETLHRAELMWESLQDFREQSVILMTLAETYDFRNEPHAAEALMRAAIEIQQHRQFRDLQGESHLLLGRFLLLQDRLEEAMDVLNQAIQYYRAAEDLRGISRAYYWRARVYFAQAEYSMALLSAQAAVDLNGPDAYPRLTASIHLLSSESYSMLGQHALALQSFRRYFTVSGQIRADLERSIGREMQLRYESQLLARGEELATHQEQLGIADIAQRELLIERQESQRKIFVVSLVAMLLLMLIFFFEARYRKRSQREQKRLNEELSSALESSRQLQMQADSANRAKTQFLANMSHEIRTPLNAVIGMATILRDTHLSEEQVGYLRAIEVSSNSLLSLLNDLLDFSKIESGKLDIEEISFDLLNTVDDVLDIFSAAAAQKGLELMADVQMDVPRQLLGDPARLRQILLNLVGNAIKFTPKGSVLLSVSNETRLLEGQVIHFSVRDTGIGIASERLHHLFEPFTQSDSSHTRKYGGTGLGLSISRRLCQLMQGELWVESEANSGSVFHVTLPFKLDPKRRTEESRGKYLKDRQVLIVDDNETNRKILSIYCKRAGMRVLEAAGFQDVRRMLPDLNCDLILMDFQMPEMDGIEITELIVREASGEVPVIMLSSVADSETRERAKNVSIAEYLTKPVKRDAFYAAMDRVLHRHRNLTAVEAPPPVFNGQADLDARTDGHFGDASTSLGVLPRSLRPLRILLVEDNRMNQRVAMILLQRMGHTVEVANNGREAVDRLREADADVVLMDLQMPVMDGLEATRVIRSELPDNRQPAIVAMTAATQKEDEQNCVEAGMDGFIPKPIRAESLAEVLDGFAIEKSPPA